MAENSITPYYLTGKSGSIGKFLCDHLESPFFDIENVRDVENWFKDRDLKDKAFLHLAAIVGEAQVKANLDKARRVNIDGTLKLAKLALEHGVNRFLFASTSHVYKPKPEFIREEDEKFPQNTYAEMKLEAEIALLEIFKRDLEKLVIFRIFSILDFDTASFTLGGRVSDAIKKGDRINIRSALDKRGFLTPLSVSKIIEMCIHRKLPGGVYNICSSEVITVKQAVQNMLEMASLPVDWFAFDENYSSAPTVYGDNSKILKEIPEVESLLHWELKQPKIIRVQNQ